MEVWGAQGGGCRLQGDLFNNSPKGGYSYGKISLSSNAKLYVAVGGKGTDGTGNSDAAGGWNGGGTGSWDREDDETAGGGGGCTSIQTSKRNDGQLKNYESVKNSEVLIVAGGGGGLMFTNGDKTSNYGIGGGTSGGKSSFEGKIATQTSGFAFGQGMNYTDTGHYATAPGNYGIPGGGGGWYGGYTSYSANLESHVAINLNAGGGSGYVKSTLTEKGTTSGIRTGHGHCIITWHPAL